MYYLRYNIDTVTAELWNSDGSSNAMKGIDLYLNVYSINSMLLNRIVFTRTIFSILQFMIIALCINAHLSKV